MSGGTVHIMISLRNASDAVWQQMSVLPVVEVSFTDAYGCVLACDVIAAENVPPFANTAVDGYAVRAADVQHVPCELRVIGELAAGAAPTIAVGAGETIRIMTGAPIPTGADAIVMVEDTERVGASHVRISASVPSGAAIRAAGSDVTAGDRVFVAGTVINAVAVGVLSSVNARTVQVYRRAIVGVLSTGDELVDDGSVLKMGQIRESNRTMLVRMVQEAGATAVDLGIIKDDEELLEHTLRDAASRVDAIVTSGGVSMGDYDVVKIVLSRIANMEWMQIAMKPAKPFAFGVLTDNDRSVPVFGLPGNPVSSMVSFELLARPALRMMCGHGAGAHRQKVRVVVDEAISRKRDSKVHFDRVFAQWGPDGRVHVSRSGAQGSHQLAASSMANALLEIPDGDGISAGQDAWALLIGPVLASASNDDASV